jgi:hypothetical protein
MMIDEARIGTVSVHHPKLVKHLTKFSKEKIVKERSILW